MKFTSGLKNRKTTVDKVFRKPTIITAEDFKHAQKAKSINKTSHHNTGMFGNNVGLLNCNTQHVSQNVGFLQKCWSVKDKNVMVRENIQALCRHKTLSESARHTAVRSQSRKNREDGRD